MLRVTLIAFGLLMASAGEASAPPSPRGGRKPSPPGVAPAETAAPAPTTAPLGAPETPAAVPATPPATPARKSKAARARDKAERILETAAVERGAPRAEKEAAAMPPSLSSTALRHEMAQANTAAGSSASEREKLEALSADLARARAALQAETARLEALLKSKPPGSRPAGEAAGTGDAAPMPVGDPLAAQRPAPAASSGNQVEVVSRALKGMKPEQAAAIIGHLNRSLAADVLQRMRPADAGIILGFLKPELGAALATEIANREAPAKGKSGDKERP